MEICFVYDITCIVTNSLNIIMHIVRILGTSQFPPKCIKKIRVVRSLLTKNSKNLHDTRRSSAISREIYRRTRLGTKLTDFERQPEEAGRGGEGEGRGNVPDVGCYGTRRLLKLI